MRKAPIPEKSQRLNAKIIKERIFKNPFTTLIHTLAITCSREKTKTKNISLVSNHCCLCLLLTTPRKQLHVYETTHTSGADG